MPSKSPAQARLMRARAHGWKPDRIKGPSVKVAKEFVAADKKAKGYSAGGAAKKMYQKVARKLLKSAQRGDKKAQASIRKYASKYERGELDEKSWLGKWALEQRGQFDPRPGGGGLAEATAPPARTIDPVPGREFISSTAPPRRRAPEDIAPGFRPGRVPPALVQYLQSLQGGAEKPVMMQFGGAMRGIRSRGRRGMRGRGQPPGGGGLARAAVMPGSAPGPGGGVGQGQPRPQPPGAGVPLRGVGRPPGMGRPGAGGGSSLGDVARRGMPPGAGGPPGSGGPQSRAQMQRKRAQAAGRGQPPGAPGGGVATPGGRGGASDYQNFLQQRKQQATAPGAGGGQGMMRPAVMPGGGFMPGGGGAGMPGATNRIGMADQQGGQARAMQVQTGRPPMSRRQGFPGRGGRRRGRFG